jgi:hypothetical protein
MPFVWQHAPSCASPRFKTGLCEILLFPLWMEGPHTGKSLLKNNGHFNTHWFQGKKSRQSTSDKSRNVFIPLLQIKLDFMKNFVTAVGFLASNRYFRGLTSPKSKKGHFLSEGFRGWSSIYNFGFRGWATSSVENHPFRQTLKLPSSGWICSGSAFWESCISPV